MPYVEVDASVRLYVEDFGDGPPVVFTHCGAANHRMWEHQVAALSGSFRTITYDQRGNGLSDVPRGGYNLERLSADLCTLIEHLGLGRAALVGHGLGSHITLRAASRRPDLVERLVLISAAPWYTGDRDGIEGGFSSEFFQWLKGASRLNNAQANWELIERFLFHRDPGPAVRQWCFSMAMQWPLFVAEAIYRDLASVDHRAALPAIACPTLVMQGRHNRKNRYGGAVYLAQQIPGARLLTFEESAENPQVEEMEAFNRELAAFLAAS